MSREVIDEKNKGTGLNAFRWMLGCLLSCLKLKGRSVFHRFLNVTTRVVLLLLTDESNPNAALYSNGQVRKPS